MIQVRAEYLNAMGKTKKDYFIFTDIEVSGHADTLNLNHTTGIKICAGVSACCYGLRRLIDSEQFNMVIKNGYFHIWTDRRHDLKQQLDRDSVYALNTLICQLYEIYCEYPMAFKSFDLVDVKEKIEDELKQRNNEQWGESEPKSKKRLQGMGFCTTLEETHH